MNFDASNVTLFYIVMYIACLMLPLVPSIVIYKLFPDSKVTAEGEVSMVKFKAGGAFGAYIVTVLIGFSLIPLIRDALPEASGETTWTVKARLELRDAEDRPITHAALLERVKVSISPETVTNSNGHLIVKIPGGDGEAWPHPLMTLESKNFGTQSVDLTTLRQEDLEMDEKNHVLRIKEPIIIKAVDNYEEPYSTAGGYIN